MTLDEIMARCAEDGDCLRWGGRVSMHRLPTIGNRSARRIVYEMARGPIPKGRVISVTCECQDCLNADHLVANTKRAVSKAVVEARPDIPLKRAAKVSAWRRRHAAKLTFADAQEVRGNDETTQGAADRLGVSANVVSRIRRGEAWKDYTDPFAALKRLAA